MELKTASTPDDVEEQSDNDDSADDDASIEPNLHQGEE